MRRERRAMAAFDERGTFKRQIVGQPIKNALWRDDKFRERAMLSILRAGDAEHPAIVTQIDFASTAIVAMPAINGGIQSNAVADFPVRDTGADLGNDARRLVTHDDRRLAAARAAVHAVDIAAADAARLDGDKHILRAGLRFRHVGIGKLIIIFREVRKRRNGVRGHRRTGQDRQSRRCFWAKRQDSVAAIRNANAQDFKRQINATLMFALSQFAMDGPTKPPKFPTALIKPMMAPREAPGMVSLTMAQKGASATDGVGMERQRNRYDNQK